MNVKPIKRNFKNVVYNFTDAQVKVREATSNDPWGPSSSLMAEVADMTHNPASFAEIMQMLWKRLNDSGRNWRHVYKALILLEYIIKTGSDRVAAQCRENIYVIQTLRDFQYYDKELNKDHGANVREKAKHLCQLLTEEEKLKTERAKALKTRERFQWQRGLISGSGAGSLDHLGIDSPSTFSRANNSTTNNNSSDATTRDQQPISSSSFSSGSSTGAVTAAASSGKTIAELRDARPRTAEEEDIQLQLALAMSKEDADKEDQMRRNDDMRLRMALNESQHQNQTSHGDDTGGSTDGALIGIFESQQSDTRGSGMTATPADPWAPSSSGPARAGGMPFISPPPSASGNISAQRSAPNILAANGGMQSSNANDLSMLSSDVMPNSNHNHTAATAAILDAFSTVPTAGTNLYPNLNQQMVFPGSSSYAAAGGRQQHVSMPVEDDAWSVRSPAASASAMMTSRPNFGAGLPTRSQYSAGGGMMHASATGGPIPGASNNLLDEYEPASVMPHTIGASHTGPGGPSATSWGAQKYASGGGAKSKEVEQFLGGHSALVDLDALLAPSATLPGKPTFGVASSSATASSFAAGGLSTSPFAGGSASSSVPGGAVGGHFAVSGGNNNPFHSALPQSVSMNDQIRSKQQPLSSATWMTAGGASGAAWDTSGGQSLVGMQTNANDLPLPLMPQRSDGGQQLLQPSTSFGGQPAAVPGYDVFQTQQYPNSSNGGAFGTSGIRQQQQPPPASSTANASYNPFL